MNSDSDWAKGAQQFQQLLGDSWGKALQSFQGLDLGAAPGALQAPSISFSPGNTIIGAMNEHRAVTSSTSLPQAASPPVSAMASTFPDTTVAIAPISLAI